MCWVLPGFQISARGSVFQGLTIQAFKKFNLVKHVQFIFNLKGLGSQCNNVSIFTCLAVFDNLGTCPAP